LSEGTKESSQDLGSGGKNQIRRGGVLKLVKVGEESARKNKLYAEEGRGGFRIGKVGEKEGKRGSHMDR